jgi:L-aminopeptidase/D-esterase-like protein
LINATAKPTLFRHVRTVSSVFRTLPNSGLSCLCGIAADTLAAAVAPALGAARLARDPEARHRVMPSLRVRSGVGAAT